jgi:hypothetical protein
MWKLWDSIHAPAVNGAVLLDQVSDGSASEDSMSNNPQATLDEFYCG